MEFHVVTQDFTTWFLIGFLCIELDRSGVAQSLENWVFGIWDCEDLLLVN
ncbi:unnamed protein product [Prunus armeniaca]